MKNHSVVLLGNYAPRCCGIATFTQDLHNALCRRSDSGIPVAMVTDRPPGYYDCPPEVQFQFLQHDRAAYRRTAEAINATEADILCLQHEFGIFGGPHGRWILDLLAASNQRIVTTCHTVLENPTREQRLIMSEIAGRSDRLVVMTEKGRDLLVQNHGVDPRKIAIIDHGIPDIPVDDASIAAVRAEHGWTDRRILLTFGLLSPNKGLEYVIRALPEVAARHPETLYVIAGATHPNLVAKHGETYRQSLIDLAEELGVSKHVCFVNRFIGLEELVRLIMAADLYATPYLHEAQITSGTLAYAFGLGKPVISTPYWHAAELLANGGGCLVPFRDSDAIARSVLTLLEDEDLRRRMSENGWNRGRRMIWPAVGRSYWDVFQDVMALGPRRDSSIRVAGLPSAPHAKPAAHALPALHHLRRMWGPHGMYQHAKYSEPDLDHGYCSDDNARAAIMLTDYEAAGGSPDESGDLLLSSFRFLQRAWNPGVSRHRNFCDSDGNWLEECGSEDSQARVMWALGHLASRQTRASVANAALEALTRALPRAARFQSPRAWSFALLGIDACRRVRPQEANTRNLQQELCNRLLFLYRRHRSANWEWIEDCVTYDNARICEAMILSGSRLGDQACLDAGLRMLQWLLDIQWAPGGWFRPIGCNGFLQRDGSSPAQWDQQPLEAGSTVGACLSAWRVTGSDEWLRRAEEVHRWFLGANDLGIPVAEPETGGCCDGLQEDGANLNQGAESTLAYLQSAIDLRRARRGTTRDQRKPAPAVRAEAVTDAA